MYRLNEINTRLEDLIGVECANNIMVDAEQKSYGEALQMGMAPQSTEQICLQYHNIIDQVLTHYELIQFDKMKRLYKDDARR